MSGERIRTLLFSTLYPSSVRPGHGVFVETRLRELLRSGAVETRVLAPVPWFPSIDARWGDYALMARTPARERHQGIELLHPRYLLPPRVGMTVAPLSLALGALPTVRALLHEGFDFDLIDAHYFYPDGVAAALLGRWLGKPYVITARGTDLNLIPRYTAPRRMMQWAARHAAALIGVSTPLVDILRGWGLPQQRLHVIRNGVDLSRFSPMTQAQARAQLGLPNDAPLLLSVGTLKELKGHHLVIDALAQLRQTHPRASLAIIGEGEERPRLEAQIHALGLAQSVRLLGARPQLELPAWYSAADLLVLASSREGLANVLLEALACGTPLVATAVGGTPEVITSDEVGTLLAERSSAAIATAASAWLRKPQARDRIREHARGFSWAAATAAQLRLFEQVRAERAGQA